MKSIFTIIALFILQGCVQMPASVVPVDQFELDKYLGKWYEIARLDHSFEKGLSKVSAEYSTRKDGGIRIINKGFSALKDEWIEAEGKAYFVNSSDIGHLKVSFFGPFYGSYIIFELDKKNYQYAFISGSNLSYLWLLSRTPIVPQKVLKKFMKTSKELGFETKNIILVDQP